VSLTFILKPKTSLPFHRRNVPVKGGDEAGFVEEHRMESLGEAADVFERRLRDALDFLEVA